MARDVSISSREVVDTYKNWGELAGYFDGDGTVEIGVKLFTVEIRLAFDENWKPHLEGIRNFLEARGINCGNVRKKDGFNTWHVVIAGRPGVRIMARELAIHCVKKRAELLLVLDYLNDRITAQRFIRGINRFVRIGERTGKIRKEAPPYTLSVGVQFSRRCLLENTKSRLDMFDANKETHRAHPVQAMGESANVLQTRVKGRIQSKFVSIGIRSRDELSKRWRFADKITALPNRQRRRRQPPGPAGPSETRIENAYSS